jgi:hypothetical protein
MRHRKPRLAAGVLFLAAALLGSGLISGALAQGSGGSRMEIYGHAMLDMGYQAKQNDPDWFDVVRPTKLPAFKEEFGKDGHWFSGVRQSRFGVKTFTPTSLGELKTTFEFELFGVGIDAGQTTFRLRHAYGELGKFGAGQTWSPFMDIDAFPNSIEYWGPNGMVFFRNVQVRWMPVQGESRVTIALERPGASGDPGIYSGAPALSGVKARFPVPDLSAECRLGRSWGYVEAAGIVRRIQWDDTDNTAPDLSDNTIGWGVNLSSNLKTGTKGVLRLQAVYGEGIENYMNDATDDIGIEDGQGKALPILGLVAFYDRNWNDKWTSTIGYSRVDIDNTKGQTASAFKTGQYGLVDLLYYPVPNVMLGPEFQWGRRENNSDDFSVDDFRVQFSAKYSFKHQIGG